VRRQLSDRDVGAAIARLTARSPPFDPLEEVTPLSHVSQRHHPLGFPRRCHVRPGLLVLRLVRPHRPQAPRRHRVVPPRHRPVPLGHLVVRPRLSPSSLLLQGTTADALLPRSAATRSMCARVRPPPSRTCSELTPPSLLVSQATTVTHYGDLAFLVKCIWSFTWECVLASSRCARRARSLTA